MTGTTDQQTPPKWNQSSKVAVRVFAMHVIRRRALTTRRKKKVLQEFIPYWPHAKMLGTKRALLHYRTHTSSPIPGRYYICPSKWDIKKWAPSFSRDKTRTIWCSGAGVEDPWASGFITLKYRNLHFKGRYKLYMTVYSKNLQKQ